MTAGTTSSEVTVGSTGTTAGGTATTAGGTGSTVRKPLRVERPSGTPDGPIFPPGTPAYRLLSEGRCQELLSTVDSQWQKGGRVVVSDENAFHLYRAAAQACLGRWDAAKVEFDKLTAGKPSWKGACTDAQECEPCKAAVLRWLTEQIQARRSDPGFQPAYVKGTGRSPCPDSTTTTIDQGVTTSTRPTTTSRPPPTTA